jgi:hypothetical protein
MKTRRHEEIEGSRAARDVDFISLKVLANQNAMQFIFISAQLSS